MMRWIWPLSWKCLRIQDACQSAANGYAAIDANLRCFGGLELPLPLTILSVSLREAHSSREEKEGAISV